MCVPFRPEDVDLFDPSSVVTIQELSKYAMNSEDRDGQISEASPMKVPMDIFDEFLEGCERSRLEKIAEQRQSHDQSLVF